MGAADVTFGFNLELKKRSSSATILDKNSYTFNWIPFFRSLNFEPYIMLAAVFVTEFSVF